MNAFAVKFFHIFIFLAKSFSSSLRSICSCNFIAFIEPAAALHILRFTIDAIPPRTNATHCWISLSLALNLCSSEQRLPNDDCTRVTTNDKYLCILFYRTSNSSNSKSQNGNFGWCRSLSQKEGKTRFCFGTKIEEMHRWWQSMCLWVCNAVLDFTRTM